jgi:ornithine cyclodeaminase
LFAPTHLTASELRDRVSIADAISALEAALQAGELEAPPRAHLSVPGGELLLMPAAGPRAVGVKLVTINPGNRERKLPLIDGIYVLFDGQTLAPVLTIDGAALTALRTAAVSALVTSRLANPGARRLVVFGAGVQACAHVEAMRAVRPIERVVIVDGDETRATALIAEACSVGLEARVGSPEDVREADIVCTCTTSASPVFPGALLPLGAHVNAIGAYRRNARELDDETIGKARIVVEDKQMACAEAGDLVIPLGAGVLDRSAIVADLPALVAGVPARTSAEEITVFKSIGVAWEDLAVAVAAVAPLALSQGSVQAAR